MTSSPRGAAFSGSIGRQRQVGGGIARREERWGYVFISPWIIGFILFTFLPMAAAFVFSLTDFDLRRPDEIHFIGLENYQRLLSDEGVAHSMAITIRFIAITVPLNLVFALGLALLLNSKRVAGKNVLRTLFYMPIQIPLVAVVCFRGDKICHEHIYWDQATVLVQAGLLKTDGLPVAGAETAMKVLDESRPSNALMRSWPESAGKPI